MAGGRAGRRAARQAGRQAVHVVDSASRHVVEKDTSVTNQEPAAGGGFGPLVGKNFKTTWTSSKRALLELPLMNQCRNAVAPGSFPLSPGRPRTVVYVRAVAGGAIIATCTSCRPYYAYAPDLHGDRQLNCVSAQIKKEASVAAC